MDQKVTERKSQLASRYFDEMNKHLDDLVHGRADAVLNLYDIAAKLCIHPRYLSKVVYQVSGQSPCFHFESGLAEVAKLLLRRADYSVTDVAHHLGYDPSNFTKFFKKYVGPTPSAFKKSTCLQQETNLSPVG